ncbi:MAG: replication initiator protein A, partial [Butyrivibrio sp.]
MPKFDYDYYSGAESEQFRFLKIPKVFFEDPDYLDLGLAECILYGFLHEQVAFSKQNGWVDEAGKTYVIRSLESIQKLLHDCSADKARSTLKNLIEFGLIEKKRRGQGKPDIIYVKNFVSKKSEKSYSEETDDCGKLFSETGKTEVLNDEKPISRDGDFLVLEVGNSAPIDPNNYLKNIIEPNHNLIQVTGNTTGAAESVDNSGWDEDVIREDIAQIK